MIPIPLCIEQKTTSIDIHSNRLERLYESIRIADHKSKYVLKSELHQNQRTLVQICTRIQDHDNKNTLDLHVRSKICSSITDREYNNALQLQIRSTIIY